MEGAYCPIKLSPEGPWEYAIGEDGSLVIDLSETGARQLARLAGAAGENINNLNMCRFVPADA